MRSAEAPGTRRRVRCAIYVRKSTEEGLDKEFNSLDAQREACSAYIASQRHEGWEPLKEHFEDGGFSGGNLNRPGLQRLLQAMREGKLDVIVVYKVDRLTRSLSDFAKIVDALDAAGASFVSITQAFNTTTSMGRLTLNVLLSFAQFEREVISERVRDKVAASKAKGMWMGGRIPIGYDAIDRKLVVNQTESETVQAIFRRYLELGTVPALVEDLKRRGITTKAQLHRDGTNSGGVPYSRGGLYHLLTNPLFQGKVPHNGQIYEGEHDAIVDDALFNQVREKLRANISDRARGAQAKSPTLLAGMIRDHVGRPMSPHHAVKEGRRYQYYVSNEPNPAIAPGLLRLPAGPLDEAILLAMDELLHGPSIIPPDTLSAHELGQASQSALEAARALVTSSRSEQRHFLRKIVLRITVHPRQIEATCSRGALLAALAVATLPESQDERIALQVGLRPVGGQGLRMRIEPRRGTDQTEDKLTQMLARAHEALDRLQNTHEPIEREERRNLNRTARPAFLAPDIVTAILAGSQPAGIAVRRITRSDGLPLDWSEQRTALGFPAVGAAKITN